MKKIYNVLLVFLALVSLMAIYAGAETLSFVFDSQEKVDTWVSDASNMTEYSFDKSQGYLKVKSIGPDPFIAHDFPEGKYLDADKYKIVVYRYKVIDGADAISDGQLFFTSENITAGEVGSYTSFKNSSTGGWQEVICDMSELEWNGKIKMFRFDHVQLPAGDVTVLVHSVSFATTMEDAVSLTESFKDPSTIKPAEWIFDTYNTAERVINNVTQMYSEIKDGKWSLKVTGSDPIISISLTESEQVLCDIHPYVAIRMSVESPVKVGGIFFGTSVNPGPKGPEYSEFEIKPDGEWHGYIIDMSSYEHKLWKGYLNALRLDPINGNAPDTKISIDRIGVFKTKEEAQAFLDKKVTINIVEDAFDQTEGEIINTGAKTPKWDLRTIADADKWSTFGGNYLDEAGFYFMDSTSSDMWTQCELHDEDKFDSNEFHYFVIRYKSKSSNNVGGIFFCNSEYPDFKDATFTPVQIKNNGEWTNLIFDMKTSQKASLWNGKITAIRFDPLNPCDENTEFTISRMGFFRSKKEALEYLNAADETPNYSRGTTLNGEFHTSIVPDGSLYEGYDKADFMLSSAIPVGKGEQPVVKFTDKSGTESIVALGNVGGSGYTKFVARKPGNYTIGYNHKDYVDILGHWGDEYITYVSDRKLFGGTSQTEFSPDMPMTRGMFITVLGRMHGLDTSVYNGISGYADVNSSEYYAPYIQWAKEFSLMAPLSADNFGAEKPIYRKDMAVVIANYVFAYKYTFNSFDEPIEFSDISTLSTEEISSIKSVQSAGIIYGKGDGIFDPQGTSTRAEVATVMQRVIKGILNVNLAKTDYAPDYFSRDRIRIGVWTIPEKLATKKGIKDIRDLGADLILQGNASSNPKTQNTLLNFADKYGIEVFVDGYPVSKNAYENGVDHKSLVSAYSDHPSFTGNYFTDEPGSDDFGWMGKMANEYQKALPGKRPFVNLLPMYANAAQLKMGAGAAAIEYYDPDPELYRKHCQMWFENFDVDYICTDIYPLNMSGETKTTYRDYCESINQIATVARENDAEFWCCIQTFGWAGGKRTPNQSEYRWQCYTMLSYGCTGILLWNYMGTAAFPSLVHPLTLETTAAYDDCKPVMWEMRNISDIFVKYKNLGAFTVNYSSEVPYLRMTGEYKNFKTLAEIKCSNPLLIGCFDAKDGTGKAFTITNMTEFQSNKSSTVKFKLDDMSKKVTSYYRAVPSVLISQDGYYTVELECGDGVFITIE